MTAKNRQFRLLSLFTCIALLSACATIYDIAEKIPGLDRIINAQSKAQVGPVKDQNGMVIEGTQAELPSQEVAGDELLQVPTQTPTPSSMASNAPSEDAQNTEAMDAKQAPIDITSSDSNTALTPPVDKQALKATPKGSLAGTIALVSKQGVISSQGVIIRLNRKDGKALHSTEQSQMHAAMTEPAIHTVDMEEKVYVPGNIVIRKGDTLNFVNKDKIQHNVFSSSGENAFDLGTFGGGLQREVKLNEEGIVKVYCNIHPNMATYVAVDDEGMSKVLEDDQGSFEFETLPAGEYELSLWSIRGKQTQSLTISEGQTTRLNIRFDTSDYQAPKRVDKFGKQYKKRKMRNEFY
jgi:plastocyanin